MGRICSTRLGYVWYVLDIVRRASMGTAVLGIDRVGLCMEISRGCAGVGVAGAGLPTLSSVWNVSRDITCLALYVSNANGVADYVHLPSARCASLHTTYHLRYAGPAPPTATPATRPTPACACPA